jgi:hypothetical protein
MPFRAIGEAGKLRRPGGQDLGKLLCAFRRRVRVFTFGLKHVTTKQLVTAIDAASQALLGRAAKAVNQALVVRNWLIGAHVLEFEQSGQDRATYGEYLLSNLAADLKARGLKGLGISMLKNCRPFYRLYPDIRPSLAARDTLAADYA